MKEKKEQVLDIYMKVYNTDREDADWKLYEELSSYHEYDEHDRFIDEHYYDLVIKAYDEAKKWGFGYGDFEVCYKNNMTFIEACADYDLI